MIAIQDKNSTFPVPFDKINQLEDVTDFFATANVFRTYSGETVSSTGEGTMDAQVYMLSGGFWQKEAEVGSKTAGLGTGNNGGELNVLLNNAPASMRGMTACNPAKGTYQFTCTRNNNFSNRDQKLTIIVSDP